MVLQTISPSTFKFNPCAVPFIPSVERNVGSAVISSMDDLRVDTGQEYWNPALRESNFHRFVDFMQMEENQSTGSPYYSSHKKNISANKPLSDLSCEMFHQSSPETRLSSWLRDEFFLNESGGGSSICDESLSATPVSSTSPQLNEDQDRNSISYGSLPLSFFPLGDATQSHSGADQLPYSNSMAASLPVENSKGRVNVDVMRYYSPFGTGVSTWLADGKTTRKESVKDLEENDGKMPLGVEEEILKYGKVWNDEDSSSREADSPGDAWMRQISVDDDNSLFTRSESKDAGDDPIQLPLWEFPNVLNPNPWLEASDKGRRSLPKTNWNGLGSTKWDRQLSKEALKEALLPTLIENNIRFCSDRRETKLGGAERHQFASPASGFEFVQRGNGLPNSTQKLPTNGQHRQQPSPYNRSENMEVLPETMFYMPHLMSGLMNPAAVPIFYIPGPTVHGHATQPAMLNPYLSHMTPFPGFMNFDYHTAMSQFYPSVDQMAFYGFGNKNPLLTSVARHTGPALELHHQLDHCYDQFRQLENERKKVEAEMARQHPGKVVTSDNMLPVPQMPPNPSRIDRLIVEVLREHTRVVTLVLRMEEVRGVRFRRSLLAVFDYWLDGAHKLQTCRKNEIINRKKYRLDRGLLQKERDVLALATALSDLAVSTRRTRTALWCGMQLSSVDLPKQCIRQASVVAKRSSASDTKMRNETDAEESDGEACDESNQGALFEDYSECNDYDNELSKYSDHNQEFDSEVGDDACFDDESGNIEDQSPLFHKVDNMSDYQMFAEVGKDLNGKLQSEGCDDKNQLHLELDEDQTEQRSEEPRKVSSDYESCSPEARSEAEVKGCSDKVERNAFSADSEA